MANRRLLLKTEATLINGLRLNMKDMPKQRLPHQHYVFVIHESPQIADYLALKGLDGLFNLTMTYTWYADVLFSSSDRTET